MGQYLMIVVEFHPKHRVWQEFDYGALKLQQVFFSHALLFDWVPHSALA
jgi:hypothetical protein